MSMQATQQAVHEEQPELYMQFGTRISKQLHRAIKIYCAGRRVSMMDFVTTALAEKLAVESNRYTWK